MVVPLPFKLADLGSSPRHSTNPNGVVAQLRRAVGFYPIGWGFKSLWRHQGQKMNNLHKKEQGSLGEALVVSQIIQHGHSAFVEFGDNAKVDVIALVNNKTHRIQVKCYSRDKHKPECTTVHLYKNGPNYSFSYTSDMFDWIAVVDVVTKKIAWLSSSFLFERKRTVVLRHEPPKNNQSNVNTFDNYVKYPFEEQADDKI